MEILWPVTILTVKTLWNGTVLCGSLGVFIIAVAFLKNVVVDIVVPAMNAAWEEGHARAGDFWVKLKSVLSKEEADETVETIEDRVEHTAEEIRDIMHGEPVKS